MSLSATLSTALTGLDVAQRALSVTANNVANAGTEGYSRKKVEQETVIVGGQGLGVRAAEIGRVVDRYLAAELRTQTGRLGRDQALADAQGRVQDMVFGGPSDAERGISSSIRSLSTSLQALTSTPEGSPERIAVLNAATDLIDRIDAGADAIQTIRRDIDREIGQTVQQINGDLRALHDINRDMARAGPTAELLDRRDALVASLAANLDLSVLEKDNGTVALYTAGGVALLEDQPRVVAYATAGVVDERSTFAPIAVYRQQQVDATTGRPLAGEVGRVLVTGGVRASLTPELQADAIADSAQVTASSLTTGRLQGLVEARDRALPQYADQLGELAGLVRHALNAAHNASVAQPPPNSVQGTRTDLSGYDGSANSGTAYLAVVDRVSGSTVSAIAIDVTAATPAGLVSHINAGLGALGTASIGSDGRLRIALADSGQGIALSEGDSAIAATDPTGRSRTLGFSHYFGLNDLVVADGAGATDLAIRGDILADGRRLASSRLDVTTGPPPQATLAGVGDTRGAAALAAALDASQATIARGGLPAGTASVAGYAADLTAHAAATVSGAESRASAQSLLVEDLAYRNSSVSGVNLDEELGRLVTYQQAYTIAARLISITDELFGELLSIKR